MEKALALFDHLGDDHVRAGCWTTMGTLAGERGDLTTWAWRCRAAHRLARAHGLAEIDALATLGQAQARLRAGRLSAASALLDHAEVVVTTCGLRLQAIQATLIRAELHLGGLPVAQRDLDAAQELAGDALRAAVDGGYRCEEALAHRLLGRCAAARSQPVETAARLGQALEMQSEIRAVLEADRTCRVITDVRPSISNVS